MFFSFAAFRGPRCVIVVAVNIFVSCKYILKATHLIIMVWCYVYIAFLLFLAYPDDVLIFIIVEALCNSVVLMKKLTIL